MDPATQPCGEGQFTKALRLAKVSGKSRRSFLASASHAFLVAACAALLLITAFILGAYGLLFANGQLVNAIQDINNFIVILTVLVAMPGATWLVATNKGATGHLRLAAIYSLLNWALRVPVCLIPLWAYKELLVMAYEGSEGTGHWTAEKRQAVKADRPWVDGSIVFLTCGFLFAMILCGLWMAITRLRALEKSCLTDLHAKAMVWLFGAGCLVMGVLALLLPFHKEAALFGVAPIMGLVVSIAMPTFLHGLWRALMLAKVAGKHAPEGRTSQARSMHHALRREILCLIFMLFTSVTLMVLWVDGHLLGTYWVHSDISSRTVEFLDVLCNEWYALNLSGALSGAASGAKARAVVAKGRMKRRQAAEAQWARRWEGERPQASLDWDEKVSELAGRGISLQALLQFFRKLPSLMPTYTPDQHTTNDVVRGAIVPFTAEAQESASTVLMEGKFTTPDKMVTHNWSNLFLDLIAAVLADALGENEFVMISCLLKSDLDRLQKWVDHAQVGGRTYWICAFSVNQHLGICGLVRPNAKDTVTGVRPTPCACGRSKALNDTEPLLPDGRSIPCEMNKFDDMMKFLAAANPAFEQVVAIDAKFSLFSRAWCVAEIATANGTGMLQSLKISSKEAMSERAEQLRGIRIQDMEASRPEDKDEILASIDDLEAFNSSLQNLLFKDLFPAWSSLDAEERLVSAGTMIRWLPVWAAAATTALTPAESWLPHPPQLSAEHVGPAPKRRPRQ